MEKYKSWDILSSLPDGWAVDKTAGSPAPRTVFITNGKSVLNGQKRALLKVKASCSEKTNSSIKKDIVGKAEKKGEFKNKEQFKFPSKTVNTLAREKFKEQLLKEIQFDLMVCEIEDWDKKEYIKELQKLINSIDLSNNKMKKHSVKQLCLFDEKSEIAF